MIKYHRNGIIAQLVEHMPYKHRVTGSSPVGPTKNLLDDQSGIFCIQTTARFDDIRSQSFISTFELCGHPAFFTLQEKYPIGIRSGTFWVKDVFPAHIAAEGITSLGYRSR